MSNIVKESPPAYLLKLLDTFKQYRLSDTNAYLTEIIAKYQTLEPKDRDVPKHLNALSALLETIKKGDDDTIIEETSKFLDTYNARQINRCLKHAIMTYWDRSVNVRIKRHDEGLPRNAKVLSQILDAATFEQEKTQDRSSRRKGSSERLNRLKKTFKGFTDEYSFLDMQMYILNIVMDCYKEEIRGEYRTRESYLDSIHMFMNHLVSLDKHSKEAKREKDKPSFADLVWNENFKDNIISAMWEVLMTYWKISFKRRPTGDYWLIIWRMKPLMQLLHDAMEFMKGI